MSHTHVLLVFTTPVQSFVICKINYSKYIFLIGYEAWALGFLDLKPAESLSQALPQAWP